MNLNHTFLLTTLAALLCTSAVRAQDGHQHQHDHDASEKLGEVNFVTSCNPTAQKQFNRAAALLHSFWYEEAEIAFTEVTKTDPGCAIGYWGIAMSNYHPIWAPPDAAELKKGQAAIEKAKAVGAKTDRERHYLAAIESFYRDSDTLAHRARAVTYEKAMEELYQRYPEDREAAVFYALSLLGTAAPTDKSYANQKRAVEILNRILPLEPEHPGIAHYIIHSFDYPALAPLALPAARSYAKIAPSSPHALHMPTHIFTRLGLWQESIQSNLASAEAARNHVARTHPGAASFDQLHAIDYLVYAYLQGNQDQKAKAAFDEIGRIDQLDQESLAAAYALTAVPARYTLERRRWAEAAGLALRPQRFPWNRFTYAEAIIYFARAIGAARNGDPVSARQDLEKLAAIQTSLAQGKDVYWAGQVEVQRRAAAAWIARAEGENEKALELMRAAAELEDSTEKHPVTPGAIIPARELLGDMLLELSQPAPALREFEGSLRNSPNRFNGVSGAAQAAELSGDWLKAKRYYLELVNLCQLADTARPELQRARASLAKISNDHRQTAATTAETSGGATRDTDSPEPSGELKGVTLIVDGKPMARERVVAGRSIKRVMPSYPPKAKEVRVSGQVSVKITISTTGQVIEAVAVSGPDLLHEASVNAAKQWLFQPTMLDGAPVKVMGTLTFNFALQ